MAIALTNGNPAIRQKQSNLCICLHAFLLTEISPPSVRLSIKAVLWHDLWVKSGELAADLNRSLPFTCVIQRWSSQVQKTEAESDELTSLCRSCDYRIPTLSSSLITTNFLIYQEIFVFFLRLIVINPQLARGESSSDPLMCSHIKFSRISTDIILGN